MSITNKDFDDKLHRIKIRLYRNYLPNKGGKYLARTAHEDVLSIEDVCSMMKTRGGFKGDYSVLLDNIKCFLKETAYEICDGYRVNMGFFSVYPNIGGTFDSAKEPFDPKKHKISFRYRTNPELRKLVSEIGVDIAGVSDANAFISKFIDNDRHLINDNCSPNDLFTIVGNKIKIEGDDDECGVFFVPVDDPSKAVKVKRIAENTPSSIIGVVPGITNIYNRIEVRTKYTGSKKYPLKEPRIITSDFIIAVA